MKIYQNTAAGIFKLANVQTDVKGENPQTFVPMMNILMNPIGPDRVFYLRKILIIFLLINLNMCFGCLKEPSH